MQCYWNIRNILPLSTALKVIWCNYEHAFIFIFPCVCCRVANRTVLFKYCAVLPFPSSLPLLKELWCDSFFLFDANTFLFVCAVARELTVQYYLNVTWFLPLPFVHHIKIFDFALFFFFLPFNFSYTLSFHFPSSSPRPAPSLPPSTTPPHSCLSLFPPQIFVWLLFLLFFCYVTFPPPTFINTRSCSFFISFILLLRGFDVFSCSFPYFFFSVCVWLDFLLQYSSLLQAL